MAAFTRGQSTRNGMVTLRSRPSTAGVGRWGRDVVGGAAWASAPRVPTRHDDGLDRARRQQAAQAHDEGAAGGPVGEQRLVEGVGVIVRVWARVRVPVRGHVPCVPSDDSAGTAATLAVHLASTLPARQ